MTEFKCPGADTYVQPFLRSSASCAVTPPSRVPFMFQPLCPCRILLLQVLEYLLTITPGKLMRHLEIESANAIISLAAYFSLPF